MSGLLLAAVAVAQSPGQRMDNARAASEDLIHHQMLEPETTLVFPDYVDGGGWSVQLVLSNVDAEAATEVGVDVYGQDGDSVLDLFDSDLTFEIQSLGSRILRSAGAGAIRRGWIEVRTRSAAISGLLTYRDTRSGIEVGVKPVDLEPQFALFVEESPTVGAGLAIYKPEAAARLELQIRDEDGNDPLAGALVRWGDFRQAARTLPEWFGVEGVDTAFLEDFRGLLFLETEDKSPLTPLGLRFGKGTSSLSAVPAIRNPGQELGETGLLVFPDYVDGDGWSVQLVLSNVDTAGGTEVAVAVYDQDGQAVADLFDSESTVEIPSLGSRILRSAGMGAIRRGWIEVRTRSARVSGLLTYRHAQTGIEVSVEPVELGNQFALFVEESGTIGAGLALLQPDATSRIELRLRDEDGKDPLDGTYLPWRDFHQAARTLPEWFDVPGVDAAFLGAFRGLLFLRTEDGSPFAPLGLRFGKGTSSLSAVPAIQIPDGGGIEGGQAPPPTVTLSVAPSSIDRGQSATLSWSSTNAESAEIEPDIGEVPTSGARKVSPNVTTTYRITVTAADGQTATAAVTVTVAVSERVALGALYEALGGSDWTHSENWLTDAPLGEWYGVEVDSQGRVIGLRLFTRIDTEEEYRRKAGIGLTGEIPGELGSLTYLRILDLSENELEGEIPQELGNLSHLEELHLSGNQLSGPIPAELGSLTRLTFLDLADNKLTGLIPLELGALTNLTFLSFRGNGLTGPIPLELTSLTNLTHLDLGGNRGLCVPGTTNFVSWSKGIENFQGRIFCNDSDRAVLEVLHDVASGSDWTNSGGWLGDGAVSEWYGVRTDNLGRVTELDLSRNGLAGRLPRIVGRLALLTELRIDGNALSGRLPLELARLPLQEFHYADTELCAPVEASFQTWLNAIPSHNGTNVDCAALTERDILSALYDTMVGPNWAQSENWLSDKSLGDWSGVRVDGRGRVTHVSLFENGLTGLIPPELGSLPNLWWLDLDGNELRGPIPPELGSLSNLGVLRLSGNRLEGEIPPELGHLSNLRILHLRGNQLTGPIPPDLGLLSNLKELFLGGNRLEGVIPPELGSLRNLEWLDLSDNNLTGPVPPEFSEMSSLRQLVFTKNPGMEGALPLRLTGLRRIEGLLAGGTNLCAPSNPGFQSWLEGVRKRRIAPCVRDGLPMAYLTQAVQSREFPVPLVAGEDALIRVFVTGTRAGEHGIPPVRSRFYIDGRETYVVDIPGKSTPVPNEVQEGSLSASANAEVPGKIVQPGLEVVIEVDPHGILDSRVGDAKRIPEKGRLAVDVQTMPVFDLTLVPFIWSETHDSSIVGMIEAMAADPESHELLRNVVTLLPVGDLVVRAHEPVLSTTNNASALLSQITALRAMEGGRGHYLGMMSRPTTGAHGLANRAARSTFSLPHAFVIGHELGHTFDLDHAACGTSIRGLDPSFPYPGGSIGAWGYDFRDGGRLVPPDYTDLMGYCNQRYWISDYHFTNALRYHVHTAGDGGLSSQVAVVAKSLLLWGGVDAGGTPFLEPTFLVDAPPAMPRSTGEYGLSGRTAGGDELFSLSFDMPEVADGDGRSSFAFTLPMQPEWAGQLARINLSGPGGSVTLDQDSSRPVTILRNTRTGQIRAILRGSAAATPNVDTTVSALTLERGLERLTSHGIPHQEDWIR